VSQGGDRRAGPARAAVKQKEEQISSWEQDDDPEKFALWATSRSSRRGADAAEGEAIELAGRADNDVEERKNVVNPDDVGAVRRRRLRMYEMFMGPLERSSRGACAASRAFYRFLGGCGGCSSTIAPKRCAW